MMLDERGGASPSKGEFSPGSFDCCDEEVERILKQNEISPLKLRTHEKFSFDYEEEDEDILEFERQKKKEGDSKTIELQESQPKETKACDSARTEKHHLPLEKRIAGIKQKAAEKERENLKKQVPSEGNANVSIPQFKTKQASEIYQKEKAAPQRTKFQKFKAPPTAVYKPTAI